MTTQLASQTRSGLRWTAVNVVGEKALGMMTTMILARLLAPAYFGVYVLAFVVIDSCSIFKNLGLDAALIQRKDRINEAADTAFLAVPLVGLVLCAIVARPRFVPWATRAANSAA